MRTEEVQGLVGRVAGVDSGCVDRVVLETAVAEARRLKSWVEGREVAFAQQIATMSSFPEKSLAEAAKTSLSSGGKLLKRAATAQEVAEMGTSLGEGRVSGEHVDVLTRTLREVAPAVREKLIEQATRLVGIAESTTPDEFARRVRDEARRLESDGDAVQRLERQRRAIRCNSWVDKQTGMGRWSVTFDPATWLALEGRLDAQIEAMFHDAHPHGCPTDPFEKQSFLRAHALLALLNGEGTKPGRAVIVVVEDFTNPQPHARPTLDWGADVDLPARVLGDRAATGQRVLDQSAQRRGDRGPRRVESRSHDTAGQPGPTTGPVRSLRDMRDPRLSCPLPADQVASPDLVATQRPN